MRRRRRGGWVISGSVHWRDSVEDPVAGRAGKEVFDDIRGDPVVHIGGDAVVAEDVSALSNRQPSLTIQEKGEERGKGAHISLVSILRHIRTTATNNPFEKLLLTKRL